jgi:hypothetical protein
MLANSDQGSGEIVYFADEKVTVVDHIDSTPKVDLESITISAM